MKEAIYRVVDHPGSSPVVSSFSLFLFLPFLLWLVAVGPFTVLSAPGAPSHCTSLSDTNTTALLQLPRSMAPQETMLSLVYVYHDVFPVSESLLAHLAKSAGQRDSPPSKLAV